MKKFLLVSLLCFVPIFSSQVIAQDFPLEEEEIDENEGSSPFCDNFMTYITTNDIDEKTTIFNNFPNDFKDAVQLELFLTKNLNVKQETIQKKLNLSDEQIGEYLKNKNATLIEHDVFNLCNELTFLTPTPAHLERISRKIDLALQQALADYKTLETRERMPFVHDGNVLPGPSRDEDGSFYVEQKFIPKFVNGSLIFLMSLSILMVIVGGLMFLFSSGDSDLTARAKTTIIWAIVGVILTILAYAIVQFIIGIDFTLG
jgi:hypothetical protein